MYAGGDNKFAPYDTRIDIGNSLEGVVVIGCDHREIAGNACAYCGLKNIAATVTDSSGTVLLIAADSAEEMKTKAKDAIDALMDNGGTLKLLTDMAPFTMTVANDRSVKIDLNGHSFTGGTLTLQGRDDNRGTLYIIDTSDDRSGSFATGITVRSDYDLIVEGATVESITANEKGSGVTLKAGSKFSNLILGSSGSQLADCLEPGSYILDYNDDYQDTCFISSSLYTVMKVPGRITADTKKITIPYGGNVPENLRPTVTMDDGSSPSLSYLWWYKDTNEYGTITATNLPSTKAQVGDELKAYCEITARDSEGKFLWRTPVTGYELTVEKVKAEVAKAPVANTLTYIGKAQALIVEGEAAGGTMVYRVGETGDFTDAVPTGEDAGNYTVWYKVAGDGNHNDTEPASLEVIIGMADPTCRTARVRQRSRSPSEM